MIGRWGVAGAVPKYSDWYPSESVSPWDATGLPHRPFKAVAGVASISVRPRRWQSGRAESRIGGEEPDDSWGEDGGDWVRVRGDCGDTGDCCLERGHVSGPLSVTGPTPPLQLPSIRSPRRTLNHHRMTLGGPGPHSSLRPSSFSLLDRLSSRIEFLSTPGSRGIDVGVTSVRPASRPAQSTAQDGKAHSHLEEHSLLPLTQSSSLSPRIWSLPSLPRTADSHQRSYSAHGARISVSSSLHNPPISCRPAACRPFHPPSSTHPTSPRRNVHRGSEKKTVRFDLLPFGADEPSVWVCTIEHDCVTDSISHCSAVIRPGPNR